MDMYAECTAMCAQSWLTVMYMYMWIVQCAVLKVGWGDLSANVQSLYYNVRCPLDIVQYTMNNVQYMDVYCIDCTMYTWTIMVCGAQSWLGWSIDPLANYWAHTLCLPPLPHHHHSYISKLSFLNWIFHVQRTNQTRVTMIGSFSTCSIAEKSSTLSTAVKMHEMTACLTFEVFFR